MRTKAEWTIDSVAMRARGIISKDTALLIVPDNENIPSLDENTILSNVSFKSTRLSLEYQQTCLLILIGLYGPLLP